MDGITGSTLERTASVARFFPAQWLAHRDELMSEGKQEHRIFDSIKLPPAALKVSKP